MEEQNKISIRLDSWDAIKMLKKKEYGELALRTKDNGFFFRTEIIEAILLQIPIPAIIISAKRETLFKVLSLDNVLESIIYFLESKEELKTDQLLYLKELGGLRYDEIDRKYQRRIEYTKLQLILARGETPTGAIDLTLMAYGK